MMEKQALLGYESLPDGGNESPQSTAATTAAAPPASPPSYAIHASSRSGPDAAAPPPLPESLPEPLALWDGAATLMSVLLGCSLGTFVISLGLSPVAAIASLCGIGAGAAYFYRSSRAGIGLDLAKAASTIRTLCAMAAGLACLLFLFSFFMAAAMSHECSEEDHEGHSDDRDWSSRRLARRLLGKGDGHDHDESDMEEWCEAVVTALFLAGCWFGAFAALTAHAFKRFALIRRLLDPATNGMLSA